MSYVMAEPDFNPADDPGPFYEDRISAAVSSQDLNNRHFGKQILSAINNDELDVAILALMRGDILPIEAVVTAARYELAERGEVNRESTLELNFQ